MKKQIVVLCMMATLAAVDKANKIMGRQAGGKEALVDDFFWEHQGKQADGVGHASGSL